MKTCNQIGNEISKSDKTIVIGLGSGRCGTLAFSNLLNQQANTDISHEWNKCLGLDWERASKEKTKIRLRHLTNRNAKFVGDVALWYLPYVEFLVQNHDVKIIGLKRVKNDTVESFKNWFGRLNHFPWMIKNDLNATGYNFRKEYGLVLQNCHVNC